MQDSDLLLVGVFLNTNSTLDVIINQTIKNLKNTAYNDFTLYPYFTWTNMSGAYKYKTDGK